MQSWIEELIIPWNYEVIGGFNRATTLQSWIDEADKTATELNNAFQSSHDFAVMDSIPTRRQQYHHTLVFQSSHDFAVMDRSGGRADDREQQYRFNRATTLQSWIENRTPAAGGPSLAFQSSHDFAVMDSAKQQPVVEQQPVVFQSSHDFAVMDRRRLNMFLKRKQRFQSSHDFAVMDSPTTPYCCSPAKKFQSSHDFAVMDRLSLGKELLGLNLGFNRATTLQSWIDRDGKILCHSIQVSIEPRLCSHG